MSGCPDNHWFKRLFELGLSLWQSKCCAPSAQIVCIALRVRTRFSECLRGVDVEEKWAERRTLWHSIREGERVAGCRAVSNCADAWPEEVPEEFEHVTPDTAVLELVE